MLDESMVRAALAGIGYDGSINLSTDEARGLSAAIGCDFFIIGKSETLARSERERESHQQAYAGVFIVEARSGALAMFDFISENAATPAAAELALINRLSARAPAYVERMIERRLSIQTPPRSFIEEIEDLPDPDSPRAAGFRPPEFLNRVRPEYSSAAEQADITATVEARVVFYTNGEIGQVHITRWAGFGLDESAEHAIGQLKFKPATRDGKPVGARALIRYNFRRLNEPTMKIEQPPDQKTPDKPVRDLRELFKPTYRRP
ncbi:MAG TPA: energy transducer TonB [Blastocatellia bacterium]|nr:energy transducer TonB [Blastocatellia bacterium]